MYDIVQAIRLESLVKMIDKRLKEGWRVTGSISILNGKFTQAIYKESSNEND